MKHLLYIFVYIFLASTAYAYEFDCSKDVRDEARNDQLKIQPQA